MPEDNLTRMIHLAEKFFEVKNDPSQLVITAEVMARLRRLHPRTLNEATDQNGPIAWVLVIPTTKIVMKEFLDDKISERDLLENTSPGIRYDAIYLCSALVLPEHRGKGIFQGLLNYAITKLKAEGFDSLGVDFESFNPTASGFWLKYFTAYTKSVVRRIDECALLDV